LVFDAHDKAFRFYGGVCRRGIYDNAHSNAKRPLIPTDGGQDSN
jgi:transposase